MEYTVNNKVFRHPDEITNERMLSIIEIEEQANKGENPRAWNLNRETIPKMMRLIVEGPHDEVDWMQAGYAQTMKIYNDFFTHIKAKAAESQS